MIHVVLVPISFILPTTYWYQAGGAPAAAVPAIPAGWIPESPEVRAGSHAHGVCDSAWLQHSSRIAGPLWFPARVA